MKFELSYHGGADVYIVWTWRWVPKYRRNTLPRLQHIGPENVDSMFLQNAGTELQAHTALQSRIPAVTSLFFFFSGTFPGKRETIHWDCTNVPAGQAYRTAQTQY
jgi:hypothetical protein